MVTSLLLAAALLAQDRADYGDHRPVHSERLRCAIVGGDGRRARFDLDIDGAGEDRRFRLRAEPGAAWLSEVTATGIEPNHPDEPGMNESIEQLVFTAGGVPYLLALGFEGAGRVQLAEAELYENRHGNPSLNAHLAAGLCIGRASAEPIPEAAPLPSPPPVRRAGVRGARHAMALAFRTRCTLVRPDLSEASFDMEVRAEQRPDDRPGSGRGTLTMSGRGWPGERRAFATDAYTALTIATEVPDEGRPGAVLTVSQQTGEQRYSIIYLVDGRPPHQGWLRVNDFDLAGQGPSLIGSGICEAMPAARGRRRR